MNLLPRWARTALAVLAVAAVVGVVLWARQAPDPGDGRASDTGGTPQARTSSTDLGSISEVDLPTEARRTLGLIDAGGPFPYSRDGVVFENREGLLPPHRRGWYHEYTVATPGSDDRGARRIVTGEDGTYYWSPDHYRSFAVVERGP